MQFKDFILHYFHNEAAEDFCFAFLVSLEKILVAEKLRKRIELEIACYALFLHLLIELPLPESFSYNCMKFIWVVLTSFLTRLKLRSTFVFQHILHLSTDMVSLISNLL